MKNEKKKFGAENDLGYCPTALQDSRNCIAIQGFVLQQGASIVLQAGLVGEAGCVTIQTLYRDCCCYLNGKDCIAIGWVGWQLYCDTVVPGGA